MTHRSTATVWRAAAGFALGGVFLLRAPAAAAQPEPPEAAALLPDSTDAPADSIAVAATAGPDTVVVLTAAPATVLAAPDSVTAALDSLATVEAHPQDSPEDRGLLIISGDGRSSLRIRGSIRLNGAYDFNGLQSTETFDTFAIPTGSANTTEPRFYMSANQTRFSLEASRLTDRGDMFMRIEGDFLGEPNTFRLRHAFGRLEKFTVGQTWSTFGDVNSVPRTVDLDGPNSSVQVRTVQVRFSMQSHGNRPAWAVAAESPEPEVNEPDSLGLRPAFQNYPNIAARVRTFHGWGHLGLAGVFESIAVRDPLQGDVDHLSGGGALFSGRVQAGASELLWQIVAGKGISRFITALSGRNLDVVYNPGTQSWETLATAGGFLSYGRTWSERSVSYFTVGSTIIQNKDFQLPGSFSHSGYLSANAFWDVTDGTRVGVEYSWGIREDKDGQTGTANRLSFIFYYDF